MAAADVREAEAAAEGEDDEDEDKPLPLGPETDGEEDEECTMRVMPQLGGGGGDPGDPGATGAAPRPLADAFMELFGLPTMSQARRAVRTGQVFVEGVKRKANFCVSGGERIEWRQRREGAPTLDRSLVPEDLQKSFRVVHEDDDLAVVWKPGGVDTTGSSSGGWSALRLSHHFLQPSTARGAYRRARAVHRLDAPTAGLVCLAKTQPAHLRLTQSFAERDVHKTYVALLVGSPLEPPAGRIDAPLRCLQQGKGAVMQDAVTEYETLQFTPAPASLDGGLITVRFHPLTGRTHQLRRHAARDLGRPILGDSRYGGGRAEGECEEASDAELGQQQLFLCAVGLDLPLLGAGTGCGAGDGRLRLNVEEPAEFAVRRSTAEAALRAERLGAAEQRGGEAL